MLDQVVISLQIDYFLFINLIEFIIVFFLIQNLMGSQCSCSSSESTLNKHEINHVPSQIQQTKPSLQEVNQTNSDKKLVTKSTLQNALPEELADEDEAEINKLLEDLKPKTTDANRKNHKKVQLIVPQSSIEESSDNVVFIEKQIDKKQQQLIVKTLNKHFILSQLSSSQIKYVLGKLRFCKIEKNKYVFKQNDPSFSYYIILEGKCKVQIDSQVKKVISKGTSFGDLGIVYNAPRSASIYSQTQCIFAELNSKTLKKIINDLNYNYQKQNRNVLENIQFYQNLSEPQKNTLASNALTEIYQVGQVIFNKGDAANAFYIVQEGVVTIFQKGIELRAGDHVGVNAIISNQKAVRSNSLIAKTACKLLSLTKQVITQTLGQSIIAAIRKNLILKILKESQIWDMYLQQQWLQALVVVDLTILSKGMIAFSQRSEIAPYTLCLILKADARSKRNPKSIFYMANSIIQQNKVFKREKILFEDDFEVSNQAEIVKIALPKTSQKQFISREEKFNFIDKPKETQTRKRISANGNIRLGELLNLDDFSVIRKLRCGNFGKVYACFNKKNKNKYAIKVMNKTNLMDSNILSYVIRQSQLLSSIKQHPFLVKYYKMFDEKNLILLVMELIEGEDLFDSLNQLLPIKLKDCRFLISQLILIIDHLHSSKIIYRDLKPQNVMLLQDGYLKLVDLGTAKQLTLQRRFKTNTIVGTPHYMAPEIVLGKGYSFSVDWWSLGVMMYELVNGWLPFGENMEDPIAVYQDVIKNPVKYKINLNDETRQVIDALLTKNGSKRIKNGSCFLKQMPFFKTIDWQKLLNKKFETDLFPSKGTIITNEQINRVLSKRKVKAMSIFLKQKWGNE